MGSQKSLAVRLSKLKTFTRANTTLEQYTTDSDIAAHVIHAADMLGDIEGKHVLDLGCGTGILGLGAVYYGARKATLLDVDKHAIAVAKENAAALDIDDVGYIPGSVRPVQADTVIMNPPFGTKVLHADKKFLLAAFKSAPVVYSMHLFSAEDFVVQLAQDSGFEVTHVWPVSFPLKNTMRQHKKKRTYIDVIIVRFTKTK